MFKICTYLFVLSRKRAIRAIHQSLELKDLRIIDELVVDPEFRSGFASSKPFETSYA